MSCGCKKDKAMVERKLQARIERKRNHELRKTQRDQRLDTKKSKAQQAAYDEYLRTRQPIGYQQTVGGVKALYAAFVFPPVSDQQQSVS